MMRQTFALALGAVLAAGLATQANAKRVKPPKTRTIVVSGCARWAAPACTIITSGGKTYSLLGGSPEIPFNVGIRAVGTTLGVVSFCPGTPVKVLRWTRIPAVCPLM